MHSIPVISGDSDGQKQSLDVLIKHLQPLILQSTRSMSDRFPEIDQTESETSILSALFVRLGLPYRKDIPHSLDVIHYHRLVPLIRPFRTDLKEADRPRGDEHDSGLFGLVRHGIWR